MHNNNILLFQLFAAFKSSYIIIDIIHHINSLLNLT